MRSWTLFGSGLAMLGIARAKDVEPKLVQLPLAATPSSAPPDSNTNVLDVARLVLESTKSQSESIFSTLNLMLGIGGTVVAVLVALAAFFGYREWNALRQARASFQQRLDTLAEDMRQEINAQIELTSARVEIDTALREIDQATANRMYKNAIARIREQLDVGKSKSLSPMARVRGLADMAFAFKRLGSTQEALDSVTEALEALDKGEAARRALLTFNAACYAAILGKEDICEKWLKESIRLDSLKASQAKVEVDFKQLRDAKWFKELTK